VGYPDGEAPDDKELRLKLCDIIRDECFAVSPYDMKLVQDSF
jgi:hypothetical protein